MSSDLIADIAVHKLLDRHILALDLGPQPFPEPFAQGYDSIDFLFRGFVPGFLCSIVSYYGKEISSPISAWILIIKEFPCKRYRCENCVIFGN